MLSILSLYTSAVSFPTKVSVAINYYVASFIECKLTLISLTENNCKCHFFFEKRPNVICY